MLGFNFYHRHIRNYVALFGTLFNDIQIQRDNLKLIKVPISYGPREKFLARIDEDPTLSRPNAIYLPAMSFEITGFSYDPSRKLNKNIRLTKSYSSVEDVVASAYSPIPYNINFELSIMTKSAEDATRIVEQIIPFFTPDFTSTVILNNELDIRYDIPLILESHSVQDSYDADFLTRRTLVHTLSFTMKAYFLGPVKSTKIIKFVDSNVLDNDTSQKYLDVNTFPGLTSDGQPTTSSNNSISYTEINSSDDYGFITEVSIADLSNNE